MKLEVFSDMVCPWCYIGKRRLQLALRQVDTPVDIVWRSFQLDPSYPPDVVWTLTEAHRRRYGIGPKENDERLRGVSAVARQIGLEYDLHHAVMANTFNAHRLVHHASAHGVGSTVMESLMRAYAVERRWIGSDETLTDIAAAAGLPPLRAGQYDDAVGADRALAARYGVHAVPTIVIDESRALVSPDVAQIVAALATTAQAT